MNKSLSWTHILFFCCRQSLLGLLVMTMLLGLAQAIDIIDADAVLTAIVALGVFSAAIWLIGVVVVMACRGRGRGKIHFTSALPPCSALRSTDEGDCACREFMAFGFSLIGSPHRPNACEYQIQSGCTFGLVLDP